MTPRYCSPRLALLLPLPALAQVPPIGTLPVDAPTALAVFDAACLSALPDFAATSGTLTGSGFARNPETGTWYHPTLDLSVQADDLCTVVFGSEAEAVDLGMQLSMRVAQAAGRDMADDAYSQDPTTGEASAQGPGGSAFEFIAFPPEESPTPGRLYFRAGLTQGR